MLFDSKINFTYRNDVIRIFYNFRKHGFVNLPQWKQFLQIIQNWFLITMGSSMGQFFTLPNSEFNNSKLVWGCGPTTTTTTTPQVQNFEIIQNWFVGPSHHPPPPKFKIKKIKNLKKKIHTLLWPLVQGLWTFLKISQYHQYHQYHHYHHFSRQREKSYKDRVSF